MDFWNGIGDFFATFEPKDWVTALIASVATIVSLYTASQTWRYHPRPLITVEAKSVAQGSKNGEIEGQDPWAWIDMSNRGNAPAYDLRATLTAQTLYGGETRTLSVFKAGDTKHLNWYLLPPLEVALNELTGLYERLPRPTWVDYTSVKIVITWRQSPTMWLRRRKRVRFRQSDLQALEEP